MGKKLAIRGHSTRGKEVIELLEMMGGKNIHKQDGGSNSYSYYIFGPAILSDRLSIVEDDDFEIFTLQDFLEKFPYKVGNKVHIYVQNDDIDGRCDIEGAEIISMRWNPTIRKIAYKMKNINREFYKEEIKCKVDDFCRDYQIEEPNTVISGINLNSCDYADEVELNLGDYEIEVRDGRTYAVKKKSKYPTTYEECIALMHLQDSLVEGRCGYEWRLVSNLQKLLLCRDAYWKIAGEQMGLDGPWKPNWLSGRNEEKYCIATQNNEILHNFSEYGGNEILAFPTIEMRDVFYENFKKEIEQCKELL